MRLGKPASLGLNTAARGNHGHKIGTGKSGLHAHEGAGPFHLVFLHELQHEIVSLRRKFLLVDLARKTVEIGVSPKVLTMMRRFAACA